MPFILEEDYLKGQGEQPSSQGGFLPDEFDVIQQQGGFIPDETRQQRIGSFGEETAKLQKEAQRLGSFRGMAGTFGKEFVKGIGEVAVKTPARFLGSAYRALKKDIPAQIRGGAPLQEELPSFLGYRLGKTYQAKAAKEQEEIVSGERPLYQALKPFGEVPLAGLETIGTLDALSAGTRVLGRATQSLGKGIYGTAFDITSKEAPLVQAYKAKVPFWERVKVALSGETPKGKPVTLGETGQRFGLKGDEAGIGIRAKRAEQGVWKTMIEPALKGIKEKVNIPSFFDDLQKQIVKETPELARRRELLDGLEALKSEYSKVGDVQYLDLQDFKSGWAKFTPEKYFKGKPVSGAYNEVKGMAGDLARNMIYKKVGTPVKQAYLDYGNLKGIQELGQRAMTEGRFKGGFGSFVSALYDYVLTPVKTIGGQTLYRTGQGIEFIGNAGAKNVGELLGKTSLPKVGSIEYLSEQNYGFKPGQRAIFDRALYNKDSETVRKMLPEIPDVYKKKLAENIRNLLQK